MITLDLLITLIIFSITMFLNADFLLIAITSLTIYFIDQIQSMRLEHVQLLKLFKKYNKFKIKIFLFSKCIDIL